MSKKSTTSKKRKLGDDEARSVKEAIRFELRKRNVPKHSIEDVVQDAFCDAWKAYCSPSWRGDATFRTLALTVARRQAAKAAMGAAHERAMSGDGGCEVDELENVSASADLRGCTACVEIRRGARRPLGELSQPPLELVEDPLYLRGDCGICFRVQLDKQECALVSPAVGAREKRVLGKPSLAFLVVVSVFEAQHLTRFPMGKVERNRLLGVCAQPSRSFPDAARCRAGVRELPTHLHRGGLVESHKRQHTAASCRRNYHQQHEQDGNRLCGRSSLLWGRLWGLLIPAITVRLLALAVRLLTLTVAT